MVLELPVFVARKFNSSENLNVQAKNDKYIEIKEAYEELLKIKRSGTVTENVRNTKGKSFGSRKFRSEGKVTENYFDHVPEVKVKTPLGFGRGNAKKSFQTGTFKSAKDQFVEETIRKYRKNINVCVNYGE